MLFIDIQVVLPKLQHQAVAVVDERVVKEPGRAHLDMVDVRNFLTVAEYKARAFTLAVGLIVPLDRDPFQHKPVVEELQNCFDGKYSPVHQMFLHSFAIGSYSATSFFVTLPSFLYSVTRWI